MKVAPRGVLVVGVVAVSWSAILVRWSAAAPAAIAFWRMAIAAAVLAVVAAALRSPVWRWWRGLDWLTGAAAALLLALHFGFWIASLAWTTVAASVVLVSTQPVFVALLGWAALGERPARRAWIGIGLAILGSAVIAGGDFALDRRALVGDALALLGALWIAGYIVLARWLRATKDLLPYVMVVYALTAVWLGLGIVAGRVPALGFGPRTWLAVAGLALVPTIIGHTAMNYALRYLRAYEVNVATLGEPIGATLLAAWLLAEAPPAPTIVGGALVLAGIFLTLVRWRTPRDPGLRDGIAAANL